MICASLFFILIAILAITSTFTCMLGQCVLGGETVGPPRISTDHLRFFCPKSQNTSLNIIHTLLTTGGIESVRK